MQTAKVRSATGTAIKGMIEAARSGENDDHDDHQAMA